MDFYFSWKQWFKNVFMDFFFFFFLASQDVNWWTGVVWITFTFTFMHLADAFIQSDLQCIQAIQFFSSMCVPWELNPWPFALLTQCSTTEPQDYLWIIVMFYKLFGLSFWRHPFTAEDPLVSKWWNATFLQIWWRNKLVYILDGLSVRTFSANVQFWIKLFFLNVGSPKAWYYVLYLFPHEQVKVILFNHILSVWKFVVRLCKHLFLLVHLIPLL